MKVLVHRSTWGLKPLASRQGVTNCRTRILALAASIALLAGGTATAVAPAALATPANEVGIVCNAVPVGGFVASTTVGGTVTITAFREGGAGAGVPCARLKTLSYNSTSMFNATGYYTSSPRNFDVIPDGSWAGIALPTSPVTYVSNVTPEVLTFSKSGTYFFTFDNSDDSSIRATLTITVADAAPAPSPAPAPLPVVVTISMAANGGSGSVASVVGDAGTWASAPGGSSLSKPGYVFAGWNTSSDGSGMSFAAGASLQLSGDNTLYAQWSLAEAITGTGTSTTSPAGTSTDTSGSESLEPTTGGGQIPASGLAAGNSLLLVGGVATSVTVAPNAAKSATGLAVDGPDFTMTLAGRGDESDPLGLTSKQALVLQSEPGAARASMSHGASPRSKSTAVTNVQPTAVSSGAGFKENSSIRFYLLADTYLGSLETDTKGAFSGSVPVPAGLTPGNYTLQANGLTRSGAVRSLSIGIVVTQARVAVTAKASAEVYFAPLSASLTQAGKSTLASLVKKTGKQATTVRCVGYVQPSNVMDNDQSLSTARARNVASYLRSLGLRGDYVVRGDGRDATSGGTARRVAVIVTFLKK